MDEILISPVRSTSEIGFSPFSIDKLELKLPLRVNESPTEIRTIPISQELQDVSQGNFLRISPFADVSLAKDQWSTNGRKFICQYLGINYKKRTKTSNFYEQSEITNLCTRIDNPSIRQNLVPFILERIHVLLSAEMNKLSLHWRPTKIRTLEVCKDYHLSGSTEEIKDLLCRAASEIEGEPIEVGEVRKKSSVPFHFKWNPQHVQPILNDKGTVRMVKVYPKFNGIRLELQIRNLKFKARQSASNPIEEMCVQLSSWTSAMVNYLEQVENKMMSLDQKKMNVDLAQLREALSLYLDIQSESGKEFFNSISSGSRIYTKGRRTTQLLESELKRLCDVNFGICFVIPGKPGHPNSLKLREDWHLQAEKMKIRLANLKKKRSDIQIEARKLKGQPRIDIWEQQITRRDFLTGGFFRRTNGKEGTT